MNKKQWQELCEWAGFEECCKGEHGGWWYPDRPRIKEHHVVTKLPPQDMNTLFKWMVPKYMQEYGFRDKQYIKLFTDVLYTALHDDEDPFEALAQAIYKVLKEEKE